MKSLTLNAKSYGVEIPTGETTTDETTSNLITATTADDFYNQTNIKLGNYSSSFNNAKEQYNTTIDNIYSGAATTDELYKLMKATVTDETMSSRASQEKYIIDKIVYMVTGKNSLKNQGDRYSGALRQTDWNRLDTETQVLLQELGFTEDLTAGGWSIKSKNKGSLQTVVCRLIKENLSSSFKKIK